MNIFFGIFLGLLRIGDTIGQVHNRCTVAPYLMKNLKICFFVFLFFSSLFLYKNVFAETDINLGSGDIISTDTIWTKDAGPYVIYESPTIESGATLTIEPGTIIKFDFLEGINVSGKLIANGSDGEKIYFTSLYDDSIGGDTDLDDGLITPNYGDWEGITALDGGSIEIKNAEIYYSWTAVSLNSGIGIFDFLNVTNSFLGIDSDNGSSSIDHSTFDGIFGGAIEGFNGSTLKISNSDIKNADGGIDIGDNSSLIFENSKIENISGGYDPALIVFSSSSIIMKNSIIDNVYGGYYALEAFLGGNISIYNSTISNSHVGEGIFMYTRFDQTVPSVLNISSSTISDSNGNYSDGIFIDGNVDANLDNVDISGFQEAGMLIDRHDNIQIKNSNIYNNPDGILFYDYWGLSDYKINFNIDESSIYGNGLSGISNLTNSLTKADAINNWWGDASGPFNNEQNASGTANQVSDNIDFIPWLSAEPDFSPATTTSTSTATTTDATSTPPIATSTAKTPVIIIPGIMGSYLNRDYGDKSEIWPSISNLLLSITDHFLDDLALNFDGSENIEYPMKSGDIIRKTTVGILGLNYTSDTFDGLIQELTTNGYEEDKDLFVFPYDWRKDNAENAGLLKNKIDEILATTSATKVDIVAHSMGGLLAKSYIAQNGTSTIDKIIFIGTPHLGAPKAYKALMYGDDMGIRFGFSILYPAEVKYISQNMPGVFELLPSKKYIDTNSNAYIYDGINKKDWLSFDETENFMMSSGRNSLIFPISDNLHDSIDNLDLENLNSFNFSGCGMTKTIGQIITTEKSNGSEEHKILYSNGDETVPLISSDVRAKSNYYVTGYSHSALPSASGIKQDILSILQNSSTAENFANVSTSSDVCLISGRAISVHSPVSLDIYDANNNHTGISSDGNIEYGVNGVSFDEINGEKFAFLPSGIDYKIILNGEGSGTFDFYIEDVSGNDKVSNEKSWLSVPIESTSSKFQIIISSSSSQIIDVDENGDGDFENHFEAGFDGSSKTPVTITNHGHRRIISGNESATSSELIASVFTGSNISQSSNSVLYDITTKTIVVNTKISTTTISKTIKSQPIRKVIAKNNIEIKNNDLLIPNIATVYDSHAAGFLKRAWHSIINFFKKIL